MPPVVALGEPDHFVRGRQVSPVDRIVARFEERLGFFLEDLPDRAGRRVGDAQLLPPVIAGRGDERHGRAVQAPLDVAPVAAARHVVAKRGPMLVGRHPQPDDLPAVDVDDKAVNHRDRLVAGQRILPGLQRRMADLRVDEIHLTDIPLILLERRDLLRVGRPFDDRPIASHPAGVVRGVSEVLDAVFRERSLPAALDVADPEVPVADERPPPPVR